MASSSDFVCMEESSHDDYIEPSHRHPLETSPREQQQQQQQAPTAVVFSDDDNSDNDNAALTLRYAMTWLFVLILPAILLSIIVANQYRLVVLSFWICLLLAFAGLVATVHYVLTTTNSPQNQRHQVFHPVVHHVVDMIQQEVYNFWNDWNEFMLLTNGEEENENSASATTNTPTNPRKKRRKSVLFRILQPPLLIFRRRKRKQGNNSVTPQTELV